MKAISFLAWLLLVPIHLVNGQIAADVFSPADYRVAFTSTCNSYNDPFDRIYTMYLDGSGLARLTSNDYWAYEWHPRWSPDGSRIVYMSDSPLYQTLDGRLRTSENTTIDLKGLAITEFYYATLSQHTPVRLTYSNIGFQQVYWLSDGRIAYNKLENPQELSIVDMNGLVWEPHTIEIGSQVDSMPIWSPDNQKFVFAANRQNQYGLYMASVQSNQIASIIRNPAIEPVRNISWSPDGKHLIFAVDRGSTNELYRVDIDGTNLVKLNEQQITGEGPIWSPSGEFIAYQDFDTLHVINPDGLKLAEIEFPYQLFGLQWLPDQSVLAFLLDDGVASEICPDSDLLSFYWLDLACLETTSGCKFEDVVRIPTSQLAANDFDIMGSS